MVDPRHKGLFEQLGLSNCAQTISFFSGSEPAPFKKTSIQSRVLVAGETSLPVFFKQYAFAKPSWRFFGRASKAKREFENYEVFEKLGIPSAQRVACGEQRDRLGRLKRAFIITRAVPNVATLAEFVPRHCPSGATVAAKGMRRRILEQLADITRQIHAVNFFRNDLYWRNILVGEDLQLCRIDCPRGTFIRAPVLQYRGRLHDLAALNMSAGPLTTARERIAFMKLYLGQSRLDANAKRLIRDVLAYGKSHWKNVSPAGLTSSAAVSSVAGS